MNNDNPISVEDSTVPADYRGSDSGCSSLPSTPKSRAPTAKVREYAAPRNDIEAGVADILAGMLMMEKVGINDNFILLGGESLLAAQAAWRIRDRFGCEVALRSILAGTVADIAAEVLAATSGAPDA